MCARDRKFCNATPRRNYSDLLNSSLFPTNADVASINDVIMRVFFRGKKKINQSSGSVEENEHQYHTEFINPLCPSCMPPHKLTVKKNSIVMLLRNLVSTKGHSNGTRYISQHLHQHVIDAVIAMVPHAGKRIFIPRIPLRPSETVFPFHMYANSPPLLPPPPLGNRDFQ